MKFFMKSKIIIVCFCLLTANAVHSSSLYFGALGGVLLTKNLATNQANLTNDLPEGLAIEYKPGYRFGAFAGINFTSFRFEAEFSRLQSEAKNVVVNGKNFNIGGNVKVNLGIINAIFEMPGVFAPYAGVGLGYAHVTNSLTTSSNSINPDDKVLGYQGILGLSFKFKSFSLFADYRYIITEQVKILNKTYSNHTVNIGFIFQVTT